MSVEKTRISLVSQERNSESVGGSADMSPAEGWAASPSIAMRSRDGSRRSDPRLQAGTKITPLRIFPNFVKVESSYQLRYISE